MHDIDERLTQLGGSLEAAAEVRSPTQVRSRGEQIRVAHRRRITTTTAVTAAVAVIGVASLVAFRPTGHKGAPVSPGASPTSSKAAAPPSGATSAVAGQLIAKVDLTQDVMKVYDGHGQVVKTIPVTGGIAAHPSQTGVFTITAKQRNMTLHSAATSPSGEPYEVTVDWVLTLDGGPSVYAAPWAAASFGNRNTTHGDIGMSTESAQWLYGDVAIGDRIQIQ